MYSLLNIAGLATGMTVAILIGLWVWDECSFDHYHDQHHLLAQVFDTQTWNSKTNTDKEIDIPIENELNSQYRDAFKRMCLVSPSESGHLISAGEKKIIATGLYAQPAFPEMFTLKMLSGSRDGLQDFSSVLLNATLARNLFGSIKVTGRTLSLDSNITLRVAGVFEDLPANTTFNFVKFLLPWDRHVSGNFWVRESNSLWGRHAGRLIVELNEHTDIDKLNLLIRDIPKKYVKTGNEEVMLLPMDKWHLYNEFRNGKAVGGRIQFVWLFSIIGIFVLFLACINFMNLSTARSQQRAKEVGIRKAIGSLRTQLIAQFLSESILTAFLALFLGSLLVSVTLPFFNSLLAGKILAIPYKNPVYWLLLIGFTLFTGLAAGSYPAFYLSGFKSVLVLKGPFRAGRFASLPRKTLVTIQFTISIALILGTIIVYRQIGYTKERPVGYKREGLISINTMYTPDLLNHFEALKSDLLKTGNIENIASSNGSPTEIWNTETGFEWEGKDPGSNPMFRIVAITHDYGKTLGWTIKDGRDFSRSFGSDSSAIILNEAAVKLTGLKKPVGNIIKWHEHSNPIIGVVRDLVMESPYKSAEPTIFFLSYGWSSYLNIRVKPGIPLVKGLNSIARVYKTYSPDRPLDFRFVDEEYAAKFIAEERIGKLSAFFSFLAIFISCLGLFGLAAFVAEQRTKEIGIRKVLGATVFNLWTLLSKEFVALVLLSLLIATPITTYYLKHWLNGYEYHTEISWWIFVYLGLGVLTITLLTVSAQSIKAALSNPVNSLKSD